MYFEALLFLLLAEKVALSEECIHPIDLDLDEIDGLELPCSSFPGTDLAPSSYLSVQSEPGSASPSSIVPVPSPDPKW